MAIDFREAKAVLREVLGELDHQYVNELPAFAGRNPTAESIAEYICGRIGCKLRSIHSVSVWETATSCATYFPGDTDD